MDFMRKLFRREPGILAAVAVSMLLAGAIAFARDGVVATEINCGDGTADSADVDTAEVGSTIGCETVTHP